MTGSHEVRGSIPLGSTNIYNNLGAAARLPLTVLCAYSVPSLILETVRHTYWSRLFLCLRKLEDNMIPQKNLFVELYLSQTKD